MIDWMFQTNTLNQEFQKAPKGQQDWLGIQRGKKALQAASDLGEFACWEETTEKLSCVFYLKGLGARGTKSWKLGTAKEGVADEDPST